MNRLSVALLLCLGTSRMATACPTLLDARSMFISGDIPGATAALNCMIESHPKDVDALRLLMDIQWWTNHNHEAQALAQSILKIDPQPTDLEPLVHAASIAHPFRLTSNLADFSGKSATSSQKGTEGNAALDYRDLQKNSYSVGYSHQERAFSGVSFEDNNIAAGFAWSAQARTYFESQVGYSLTARFSPRWFAGIEPHYIFADESDVSIGYQYSKYTTEDTSLVTMSWLRPLNERLTPSARIYALLTSHLLLSGMGSLKWKVVQELYVKGTVAGGRTLEAPGLEDPFYSWGVSAGHYFTPSLDLHLDFSFYHSDFRNEDRVGIGVDWLL